MKNGLTGYKFFFFALSSYYGTNMIHHVAILFCWHYILEYASCTKTSTSERITIITHTPGCSMLHVSCLYSHLHGSNPKVQTKLIYLQIYIDFFLTVENNGNKTHDILSGLESKTILPDQMHQFPSGANSRDFISTPQRFLSYL